MPTREIIGGAFESHYVGSTSVPNPILILNYNGNPVPGGIMLFQSGGSYRYVFPTMSGTSIYLASWAMVYGTDVPAISGTFTILVAG